jgi:hypothetical protein
MFLFTRVRGREMLGNSEGLMGIEGGQGSYPVRRLSS